MRGNRSGKESSSLRESSNNEEVYYMKNGRYYNEKDEEVQLKDIPNVDGVYYRRSENEMYYQGPDQKPKQIEKKDLPKDTALYWDGKRYYKADGVPATLEDLKGIL